MTQAYAEPLHICGIMQSLCWLQGLLEDTSYSLQRLSPVLDKVGYVLVFFFFLSSVNRKCLVICDTSVLTPKRFIHAWAADLWSPSVPSLFLSSLEYSTVQHLELFWSGTSYKAFKCFQFPSLQAFLEQWHIPVSSSLPHEFHWTISYCET